MDIETALRLYATMINEKNCTPIEPHLAEDFHYASQDVFSELESKNDYLNYMAGKLQTIQNSGVGLWAEMGVLKTYPGGPCVVLAQYEKDNLVGVVLAEVMNGKIARIDLSTVMPHPGSVHRTGDYPYSDQATV